MAGKIKKISAVLMIGIISMTAVAGCSAPAAESEKESVAESAKMDTEALSPEETAGSEKADVSIGEFTMQDVDGTEYTETMFEDYELTMVNIFATWCTPCINEIPDLEKLRNEMTDKLSLIHISEPTRPY